MSVWLPLQNLVRPLADRPRPLRQAVVLDVSGYTTSGASFITVQIDGHAVQAIYRDGPAPAVGSTVQVYQTAADLAAPWLALPLPTVAATPVDLLFSAFDFAVYANSDTGETALSQPYAAAIIKRDSTTGHFAILCDHPITATNYYNAILATAANWGTNRLYARGCPIKSIRGRVYTWVWWLDEYVWGPDGSDYPASDLDWSRAVRDDAPNCWISTDKGATWSASGSDLYGLRYIDEQGAGTIYAVVTDGKHIIRSTDSGASWSTVYTWDGTNLIHACAADPTNADGCSWNTRLGSYSTDDNFSTVAGPYGPLFQEHSDGADDYPQDTAIFRHGGRTLAWSGHGSQPNAQVTTGGDTVPYAWGAVWAGDNPLIGMTKQQAITAPSTIGGTGHSEGQVFNDYQSHFVRDGSDLYFISQHTSDGSIYKSTDGGDTWTSVLPMAQQTGNTTKTGPGAAAGLVRTTAGLWAGGSMGSIYGANTYQSIDYDPVTNTLITGKQRLYHNDGSGWVEQSDPLYADTSTDPASNTGRQYVWWAHGMTGV